MQMDAGGMEASGEQFGEDGVRLTTTGFVPSVRICNDWVLGETYFGVIRPAFGFDLIPIVNATFPVTPLAARGPTTRGRACDRVGSADVPTPPPPLQPSKIAAQSPARSAALMVLVQKLMPAPFLIDAIGFHNVVLGLIKARLSVLNAMRS
jgi:hypothetical protein